MEEHIVSLFVMEIDNGFTPTQILQRHPEIASFINTNPEVKKLINGRLTQQRAIGGPTSSPDSNQNVTDINQNRNVRRSGNGMF
jgi:hypothetical protein